MRCAVIAAALMLGWPVSAASSASACEATKAAYDRLRLQMTPEEVFEVVGCPGGLARESETEGLIIQAYTWKGDEGGSLDVSFHNGKLASKTQARLR